MGDMTPNEAPSQRQIDYATSLASERWSGQDLTDALAVINTTTKKGVSAIIDGMLKMPKAPKPAAAVATNSDPVTATGMHVDRSTGQYFRVRRSMSTKRLYALSAHVRSFTGQDGKIAHALEYGEYDRNLINRLTGSMKLTFAEASEFGLLFGICIECGADLHGNQDRSIAAGYGETCAKNNGWPYPSAREAARIIAERAARVATADGYADLDDRPTALPPVVSPQDHLNELLAERPAFRDVENLWPDKVAAMSDADAARKIAETLEYAPQPESMRHSYRSAS